MLIQILLSFFILFVVFKLFLRFRKKTLQSIAFLIWLIFWLLALIAVWVPGLLTQIANLLGIGRGADLIFYISLLIIFYLIFRIYIKFEKIEKDITKIVRKDALTNKDN
ncbi:DUF2304 domain-containing protein [Candidatus Parcubacteria bacterium]|nr:DUF2304 domain-containing protein [Patescibacteria group bacterium]MBU4482269.1 DUF2304 domain-containing protein [Patescibacteria group bacterium]MCG2687162.1 DUF2304 domain-containing protein [Candidatus Parcubacteria bacterium]